MIPASSEPPDLGDDLEPTGSAHTEPDLRPKWELVEEVEAAATTLRTATEVDPELLRRLNRHLNEYVVSLDQLLVEELHDKEERVAVQLLVDAAEDAALSVLVAISENPPKRQRKAALNELRKLSLAIQRL